MRLIDADALMADVRKNSESYFADDFAHEWVDKQPTIDAVPVVRCRECKYTETDCVDNIHCQKWDRWEMPPDGYCALGQRREDGDA